MSTIYICDHYKLQLGIYSFVMANCYRLLCLTIHNSIGHFICFMGNHFEIKALRKQYVGTWGVSRRRKGRKRKRKVDNVGLYLCTVCYYVPHISCEIRKTYKTKQDVDKTTAVVRDEARTGEMWIFCFIFSKFECSATLNADFIIHVNKIIIGSLWNTRWKSRQRKWHNTMGPWGCMVGLVHPIRLVEQGYYHVTVYHVYSGVQHPIISMLFIP